MRRVGTCPNTNPEPGQKGEEGGLFLRGLLSHYYTFPPSLPRRKTELSGVGFPKDLI